MNVTLGVAAHVDAGKTTLCEQMLLLSGDELNTERAKF